jgi:hypothetical protein
MTDLSADWPSASKRSSFRKALRLAAIVVVAGVAVLASFFAIGQETRMSEGHARSLIADHLSHGATVDDIYAFLNSRHIYHYPAGLSCCDPLLADAGYGINVPVVSAIMDDTAFWVIGHSEFKIYFVLDENDRLQDYIVQRTEAFP